jgi:hypothetical protein
MSLKLRTRHGCVEVKILYVDGHEPHTGGGDNTVEEEFGGKHVRCGCAAVTRKVDAIATYSEANAVGVLFFGPEVGNNSAVCDVAPSLGRDVGFGNEH